MSKHIRTAFMDGLVLAIAADEKTVTRRIIAPKLGKAIRPQPGWEATAYTDGLMAHGALYIPTYHLNDDAGEDAAWDFVPMRAAPGDIMDVCEALVRGEPTESAPFEWVAYRPDGLPAFRDMGTTPLHVGLPNPIPVTSYECIPWPWKVKVIPARYCPTWAVRHHRRLVSVRPERLSQVTDAEAVREGIARLGWEPTREAFLRGFRQMHGLAEDADPWVERREWAPGEVQS